MSSTDFPKQAVRDAEHCNHSLLSLRKVTKNYTADGETVHALRGVSLDVHAGVFLALVGRSGCGKSTLLHLAGAMDSPTSGDIWLDGVRISQLNDAGLTQLRREKVGFVFQSFQLLHTLTVLENIELPLLLAGKTETRAKAMEKLEQVELSGMGSRWPHQLSGGQMQRVAIARALVHEPKLLLADEPTGNLDTTTGNVILELLRKIANDHQTTILMATHSVESCSFADRIVKLRDGQIDEVLRG
jgi:ABC-type lipoprotein export system ATPase subunit